MNWIEFIKDFGFPAVCCGGLGWYVVFQTKNFREELKEFRASLSELRQSREEESKTTLEALNNNTLALQKLTDRIEAEVKGKGDTK